MSPEAEHDPVAATPSGRVRGRRSGVGYVFAGIPFAQPPLGSLRFASAHAARPWDDIRSALEYPPAPAQADGVPSDEDCLYLNVWTPSLSERLPVVVWFYGGGFEGGSASPPATDGQSLSTGLNAVVVAANYRVGALGFLHSELGSNMGIQDAIAALEWVHESVAAFGGDPGCVTVMGESAGAFLIGALLGIPSGRSLFDGAILQSGSTSRVFPISIADRLRSDLFERLQVDTLAELQGIGAHSVIDAQTEITDRDIGCRNLPGGKAWGTVLDGKLLREDPQCSVSRGNVARIPLLVTTTRDEVQAFEVFQLSGFAPDSETELLTEMNGAGVSEPEGLLKIYKEADTHASLARLRSMFLSDFIYRWPAQRLCLAQAAAGGLAFLAEFTARPFGDELGACHASEMAYLFGSLGTSALCAPDTAENRTLKKEIYNSWRHFVHEGVADWPAVHPDALFERTRQFGPPQPHLTLPQEFP